MNSLGQHTSAHVELLLYIRDYFKLSPESLYSHYNSLIDQIFRDFNYKDENEHPLMYISLFNLIISIK